MHEAHFPNGRIERTIICGIDEFDLRRRLAKARQDSLAAGATKVIQRKIERNDLCPCGRGRKFKNCCMPRNVKRRPQVKPQG